MRWGTFFVIGVMWVAVLCLWSELTMRRHLLKGETREEAVNHLWMGGYPFIWIIGLLTLLIASSFQGPFLLWIVILGEAFGVGWSAVLTTAFYIEDKPRQGRADFDTPLAWVLGYIAQVLIPPLAIWPWWVDNKKKKREARGLS